LKPAANSWFGRNLRRRPRERLKNIKIKVPAALPFESTKDN
jgi:hypothetical protein